MVYQPADGSCEELRCPQVLRIRLALRIVIREQHGNLLLEQPVAAKGGFLEPPGLGLGVERDPTAVARLARS